MSNYGDFSSIGLAVDLGVNYFDSKKGLSVGFVAQNLGGQVDPLYDKSDKMPFNFDDSYEVSREVLNKISKNNDLNYIGIGKRINQNQNYKNRVLILEDLSDPLNIGRIMEAAYLFGFDSLLLSNNCADIYHPKCIEASKGNIFRLNIYIGDIKQEINELKNKGFKVYATGLKDNTLSLDEVKESDKMAIILGNEGSGVSEETFALADEIIKIDMHTIDSLNVAMAGAILMYRFANM